jgi:hypothetical protein
MKDIKKAKAILFFTVMLYLAVSVFGADKAEIVELKFSQPPVSDTDTSRTLQSLVKVRDISERYSTGGLYLMSHYGAREELFRKENQRAIDQPMIDQSWRYCSVFSASGTTSVLMGRNWDNQNVGSIIISLYQTSRGSTSISFSRAIDMDFPLNVDLKAFTSSELGKKLLLAPFYAYDGINEHGLAVAVAGVRQVKVKPKPGAEPLFVSYLVRKILDYCKTIREAEALAEKYIPFDLDINSLNTHLLVADASGQSVILEYDQDQWRKIVPDKTSQVLTNKPVYHVQDSILREKCWRFRRISETLDKTEGSLGWKSGLKILRNVAQKGTTWSVVYSLADRELYFSIYQDWNRIYHLKPFAAGFQTKPKEVKL